MSTFFLVRDEAEALAEADFENSEAVRMIIRVLVIAFLSIIQVRNSSAQRVAIQQFKQKTQASKCMLYV